MMAKRVEEHPRPGETHKRKVWLADLKKDVNIVYREFGFEP